MLRSVMLVALTGVFVLTLDDAPAVQTAVPLLPNSASVQKSAAPAAENNSTDAIVVAQAETQGQASRSEKSRRVRPQIRVTPRALYRNYHSPYPVPYAYEYPGPGGVRHCVDRYVTERRPSGTVLVPRMRCWWEVRR